MSQDPEEVSRSSIVRFLRHWLVFSVGLALLQVWVGWLFCWLNNVTGFWKAVFLDGSPLFFANAVAMGVLARRWDEIQIMISLKEGERLPRPRFLFYELFIPLVILGLVVTVYCVILGNAQAASPSKIIFVELLVAACALLVGALHELDFRMRFEVNENARDEAL